ncbi:MAG: LPXTG cell wall anchor domain-containing protein [Actinomycetota bacterium]
MKKFQKASLLAVIAGASVVGISSTSGASAACNAADYTSGGVFDLEGYTACLALPTTGSDLVTPIGTAAGLLVLVGAGVLVSGRRKSESQV